MNKPLRLKVVVVHLPKRTIRMRCTMSREASALAMVYRRREQQQIFHFINYLLEEMVFTPFIRKQRNALLGPDRSSLNIQQNVIL